MEERWKDVLNKFRQVFKATQTVLASVSGKHFFPRTTSTEFGEPSKEREHFRNIFLLLINPTVAIQYLTISTSTAVAEKVKTKNKLMVYFFSA